MKRALAVLCVVALGAGPAHAHFGQVQAGKFPFFVDGLFVGAGTTWGLIEPDGDHYGRVCEESIGPIAYTYHRRADDSVLIGAIDGLKVTADHGCTYAFIPNTPFAAKAATALTELPDGKLLLVTGTVGLSNGVYASDDDGDSWREVMAPLADVQLFRLIASPDGQHVFATGQDVRQVPARAAVFFSNDFGETFTDEGGAGYDGYQVFASSWDTDGTTALFAGYRQDGKGIVLRVPSAAPDSPVLVGTVDTQSDVIAALGDSLFALVKLQSRVFRMGPDDTEFVQVSDVTSGPTDCIFVNATGDGLIGCGQDALNSVGMFMESDDGVTWTSILDFEQIDYRICPSGDIGFSGCATKFESSCTNDEDEDNDGLLNCEDPDCARRCGAEGEGEGGEGEGGEGEGGEGDGEGAAEGEGEGEPSCACAHASPSAPVTLAALGLGLLALRRRR